MHGEFIWVRTQDLLGLAPQTVGANLDSAANTDPAGALEIPDVVNSGVADFYLGRTSGNDLLVATAGGVSLIPLRIYSAPGGSPGGSTEIADNSIAPDKAMAGTAAEKKAWRERLEAAHIGAGQTLPAAADSNVGDVRIFPQDVASGLSWRDISNQAVTITSADSGDVALFLGGRVGWVRVGNIIQPRTRAWRALSGSSPYTVEAADQEFRIEVSYGRLGVQSIDVARAQLTAGTAKVFALAENRVDGSSPHVIQVSVTINAAGTGLTVALGAAGGNANQWTLGTVLAR